MRRECCGLFLLAGLLAVGCGSVKPSKGSTTAPSGNTDETGGASDATSGNSKPVTYSLKAEYASQAVDIIMIRENTASLNRDPFAPRIYTQNQNNQDLVQMAADTFAARLMFSGLDFHFGVVDGASAAALGTLLAETGNPAIITPGTPSFLATVKRRMGLASTGAVNNYQPLTALKKAVEMSGVGGSPNSDFLRPGAFLAILFMGYSDEAAEHLLPDDIEDFLDQSRGTGNWSVSAIVPEALGCIWDDQAGQHTNPGTTPEDYVRRNLILRLQRSSGGLFTSVCSKSYTEFMDGFIVGGTKLLRFALPLPTVPDAKTIRVSVGGMPVDEWEYRPEQRSLLLPTSIPSGTDIEVSYVPVATETPTTATIADDGVPDVKDKTLTAEEIEYLDTVNPILRRSCGCHGNRVPRFIDNFAVAVSSRSDVKTRIELPLGAAGRMPPTGDIPVGDFTVLQEWVSRP